VGHLASPYVTRFERFVAKNPCIPPLGLGVLLCDAGAKMDLKAPRLTDDHLGGGRQNSNGRCVHVCLVGTDPLSPFLVLLREGHYFTARFRDETRCAAEVMRLAPAGSITASTNLTVVVGGGVAAFWSDVSDVWLMWGMILGFFFFQFSE